ncbi:AbrB/MazE/SpoVT family DNA-binding domain-containing protein [Candidatus Woesearchaeota archaeon]|nr:AbrB/MazE/SpoVT family DNA-binding domain-containing protein [Candidatus Woesearchaeota archaeon]
MKRSVIQLAKKTLVVSLPNKWVKQYSIEKGDELELEELEHELVIRTRKDPVLDKKIDIDVTSLDASLVKSILGILHKSGYDVVNVRFGDSESVRTIQNTVNSLLIGYEIIEHTPKNILIKNISSGYEVEIDNILRRNFLITLSLAKETLQNFKRNTSYKLQELLTLEETNNKLTNFYHRILHKRLSKDIRVSFTYVITWILENICDDFREICKYYSSSELKLSKESLDIMERVNCHIEGMYHLFYKYNYKQLTTLMHQGKELKRDLHKHLKLCSPEERTLSTYLFTITQRVNETWGSITGLHY